MAGRTSPGPVEWVKCRDGLGPPGTMAEGRSRSIRGEGRELDCLFAFPEADESEPRHPVVLIIHDVFGPDAHIRDVGRGIAALGYVGVAPDLIPGELHRRLTPANIALARQAFASAPPDVRQDPSKFAAFTASQPPERRPVLEAFGQIGSPAVQEGFARDLLAVAQHVRGLPEVDGRRVAAIGFGLGGGVSARLATLDPDLTAAVIFFGPNPPLDDVPRIRARMIGFYGSEDAEITGTVPQLAAAMAAAGKKFEYRVYPSAKHAFFDDTRPTYHRMSANDAWDTMVRFFGETLNR